MPEPSIESAGFPRTGPSGPDRRGGEVSRSVPPTLKAVEIVRSLRGKTAPSLLRCDDGKYYVVKSQRHCFQQKALANEMFANRLALRLGLPIRSPVVVEVPGVLDDRIPDPSGVTTSACLQFGSAFPDPPSQTLVTDFLPDQLLERTANVTEAFLGAFAFDLWTCNSGRREAIFTRSAEEAGARYFAWLIDYDECFNNGDWELPTFVAPCIYRKRSVYRGVRDVRSFEPILSLIESLRSHEIDEEARNVPARWYGSDPKCIFNLAEQLFNRRKSVRQVVARAISNGLL
jgi:HipA-like kinase